MILDHYINLKYTTAGYDIFQLKKCICPLATIEILVSVLLLGKKYKIYRSDIHIVGWFYQWRGKFFQKQIFSKCMLFVAIWDKLTNKHISHWPQGKGDARLENYKIKFNKYKTTLH